VKIEQGEVFWQRALTFAINIVQISRLVGTLFKASALRESCICRPCGNDRGDQDFPEQLRFGQHPDSRFMCGCVYGITAIVSFAPTRNEDGHFLTLWDLGFRASLFNFANTFFTNDGRGF
jgi:hypothetical protein